jgi:hypothetical protein
MYKVESDFIYKGYRCVVIFGDMGHRCGYVGVEADNPLYGKDYTDYLDINKSELDGEPIGKRGIIPILCAAFDAEFDEDERVRLDVYFNVHGGLTYAGDRADYPVESNLWWLGFDCGHYNDGCDLDLVESYWGDNPQIQRRLRTCRDLGWDDCEVRTQEYVENECKSLVDQIIELTHLL